MYTHASNLGGNITVTQNKPFETDFDVCWSYVSFTLLNYDSIEFKIKVTLNDTEEIYLDLSNAEKTITLRDFQLGKIKIEVLDGLGMYTFSVIVMQ